MRVRLLSSQMLPVDFDKIEVTLDENDNTSEYLKPSTYSKNIDIFKSNIHEYLKKR